MGTYNFDKKSAEEHSRISHHDGAVKFDGWVNVLTGLGMRGRDKNIHAHFWTHQSRSEVIATALRLKVKELELTTHGPTWEELKKIIDIFIKAGHIETEISELSRGCQLLEKKQSVKANELKGKEGEKMRMEANANIPPARKELKLQEFQEAIQGLKEQIDSLKHRLENRKLALTTVKERKNGFLAENKQILPHSYREATFQMALDITLPSGKVIYKQYDDQGMLITSPVEDPHETNHTRFSDAAHLPYTELPIKSLDE